MARTDALEAARGPGLAVSAQCFESEPRRLVTGIRNAVLIDADIRTHQVRSLRGQPQAERAAHRARREDHAIDPEPAADLLDHGDGIVSEPARE